MPTVDELLQWHEESRMSEIMAADTMADAFRLFAEVNGLDQNDQLLKFVWTIGCTYMACRAAVAMRSRSASKTFAEKIASELIADAAASPSRHN